MQRTLPACGVHKASGRSQSSSTLNLQQILVFPTTGSHDLTQPRKACQEDGEEAENFPWPHYTLHHAWQGQARAEACPLPLARLLALCSTRSEGHGGLTCESREDQKMKTKSPPPPQTFLCLHS